MSIKYGELTIFQDKEKQNIFTYISMLLNNTQHAVNNYKYVFLFDDGDIYDRNDNQIYDKFKFINSNNNFIPLWFEKNKHNNIEKSDSYNRCYFYKKTMQPNTKLSSSDFDDLFNSYSKYNNTIIIPSHYNSIYYCFKDFIEPEVFGLIQIKANKNTSRFIFAYDTDEFKKEEIINLIIEILNLLDKTYYQ